jgi:hypothetical protein
LFTSDWGICTPPTPRVLSLPISWSRTRTGRLYSMSIRQTWHTFFAIATSAQMIVSL